MGFFKRHIISTVFLGLYIFWWILFIYWFSSNASIYPNSCGAANGMVVIYSLLISAIYVLTLMIKIITSSWQDGKDYFKMLGFVIIPPVLIIFFLFG